MLRKVLKGARVLREPQYRRALRNGVAATIEMDAIPLRSDVVHVIDVGANRGQFLTWAAARFPVAEFDCFEPFAGSRAKLEKVLPPGRTVRVHPVAVSESSGESTFHVTRDDDSSSLLSPTSLQSDTFSGAVEKEAITVPVRTLDDEVPAVRSPSLLKLDIQGGELAALRGARRLLTEVDLVVTECSFVELYDGQALADEIVEHMLGAGFRLRGYFAPTSSPSGQLLQADALFER